jgi:hypothetical protein
MKQPPNHKTQYIKAAVTELTHRLPLRPCESGNHKQPIPKTAAVRPKGVSIPHHCARGVAATLTAELVPIHVIPKDAALTISAIELTSATIGAAINMVRVRVNQIERAVPTVCIPNTIQHTSWIGNLKVLQGVAKKRVANHPDRVPIRSDSITT